MAGVAIDAEVTIKEAIAMARARDKAMWTHTGTVCATIANMARAKGTQPFTAADFSPYGSGEKRKGIPMTEYLRAMERTLHNG